MSWNQAQTQIKAKIKIGTDVNTPRSNYRVVRVVHEHGFLVPIGQSNKIKIPWNMLEECFAALNSLDGYDGAFFRKRFPIQAKNHPCYVHVIGQIFVRAGIAQAEGNQYRMLKHLY